MFLDAGFRSFPGAGKQRTCAARVWPEFTGSGHKFGRAISRGFTPIHSAGMPASALAQRASTEITI